LKDLIEIPTTVHKADFVISLADGIDRPRGDGGPLRVTDQILDCFERALGSSTRGGSKASKGAYLHGSFGSGKSHFMAVLTSAHRRSARPLPPEFAPLVARSTRASRAGSGSCSCPTT
jgi:hypothetical protein